MSGERSTFYSRPRRDNSECYACKRGNSDGVTLLEPTSTHPICVRCATVIAVAENLLVGRKSDFRNVEFFERLAQRLIADGWKPMTEIPRGFFA